MYPMIAFDYEGNIQFSGDEVEFLVDFLEEAYQLKDILTMKEFYHNYGKEYKIIIEDKIFYSNDWTLDTLIPEIIKTLLKENLIDEVQYLIEWYNEQFELLSCLVGFNFKELNSLITAIHLLEEFEVRNNSLEKVESAKEKFEKSKISLDNYAKL